jgi:hypothetical protein
LFIRSFSHRGSWSRRRRPKKEERKKEDQGLKIEDLRSGLNFQIQIKKHAHQRERVVSSNSTRVWLGRLPLMVEARLYRWVHYGYCPRRVEAHPAVLKSSTPRLRQSGWTLDIVLYRYSTGMVFLPASTSHIYIYCTHESKASTSLPAWLVAVVQTIVVDGIAIACRHGTASSIFFFLAKKECLLPENGNSTVYCEKECLLGLDLI